MAKKKIYSLTAKQRKELRAQKKDKTTNVLQNSTDTEVSGDVAAKNTKKIWILVSSIVVGLILILTAILLPILISKYSSKYPVATITLEDGRKIKFEIWEDQCPIAATNFIFLSKIGYFDGTILYDLQNEFIRFGNMEDYKNTRGKNKEFLEKVKKSGMYNTEVIDFSTDYKENLFGYKLKSDTDSSVKRSSQLGVLSYVSSHTADFMINLGENNTAFYSQNDNSTSRDDFKSSVRAFGQVLDEDSMEVLKSVFYDTEKDRNPGIQYYVGTVTPIRIKTVKVINLNSKKWKKFEFASYMNTMDNGNPVWSGWSQS